MATSSAATRAPAAVTSTPSAGGSSHPAGTGAAGSPSPVPVPSDLQPPLARALQDVPVIYTDGCHLGFGQTEPGPCTFGDPRSTTTVVLFGDSKAGQWFPALLALADARGWRLVSLTKSACAAADVAVWSSSLGREYGECDAWRENALARIAAERPALVVMSEDRLYELAVGGRPVPLAQDPADWDAGLSRTLTRLRSLARSVALIGDTPRSRFDAPTCLAAHQADAMACATPERRAIDPARLADDARLAAAAGAIFIDPTAWICPADPCPPVIGTALVYREQDHLTAVFAAELAPRLGATLGMP
jgi:SGNH domain (fused to AT3 domains)